MDTERAVRANPVRPALLLVAALALGSFQARAEDAATRTPTSKAADEVVAACETDDASRLAALACAAKPGPWALVEELARRGEQAAAGRLAASVATTSESEALRAYIDWRGERAVAPEASEALEAVLLADAEGDSKAVLVVGEVETDGVTAVRIAHARGIAHARLRRTHEAAESLLLAAESARELGWLNPCAEWLRIAARCEMMSGDFNAAVRALEIRLAVLEEIGGEEGVANGLTALGAALQSVSEFGRALDCVQRAKEIRERIASPQLETTLGALASIHRDLGDVDLALAIETQLLESAEARKDERAICRALTSMGVTKQRLKDAEGARADHRRALEIARRLGIEGAVAANLGNLGVEWNVLGDTAKAYAFHEEALALFERLGDHNGVARTLGNLGLIHFHRGEYQKAVKFYAGGVARAMRAGNKGLAGFNMEGLACSHLEAGRPRVAVTLLRTLVSGGMDLLKGLSFRSVAQARETFARVFGSGFIAAARAEQLEDVAFFLEAGRADSLLTAWGGFDAIEAADIPEDLIREEEELRAAHGLAATAYRRATARGLLADVRKRRAELEAAATALADVVERIERRQRAAVDELFPKPASLEAMRSHLRANEALILYGLADEGSIALVLRKDAVRLVDIGDHAPIEAACEASLAQVGRWASGERGAPTPDQPSAAPAETPAADALATLRSLVIEPLELGKDVRRLLISPHGPLGQIPFALLANGREVAYVPSGTVYGLLARDADLRGDGVLALGDPVYGKTAYRGRHLASLPHTRTEAQSVGDVVLLGGAASETALRAEIGKPKRWRAIHLACHGLIDMEEPSLSALAVTADAQNDGFVTVHEVLRRRIASDLIVLSGCETAQGKVIWSEGIEGFPRAFLFSGSPRVIVSLWKVDDRATAALMSKLYALWNPAEGQGLPLATALVRAQEHVRAQDEWSHPFFWGAWVLWGLPE